MTFIKFPCGDLEPATVIKYEGEQVCVKMSFGLFWLIVELEHAARIRIVVNNLRQRL